MPPLFAFMQPGALLPQFRQPSPGERLVVRLEGPLNLLAAYRKPREINPVIVDVQILANSFERFGLVGSHVPMAG